MGKAEPDLSEFVGISDPRGRGQKCALGRAEREMSREERDKYGAAMMNPAITNRAIAEVVGKWGYATLSQQIVRRHRVGECGCARPL